MNVTSDQTFKTIYMTTYTFYGTRILRIFRPDAY